MMFVFASEFKFLADIDGFTVQMVYYSVLFFVSQYRWNTILCYSLFHSADGILFCVILSFTVQMEYYSVLVFVS